LHRWKKKYETGEKWGGKEKGEEWGENPNLPQPYLLKELGGRCLERNTKEREEKKGKKKKKKKKEDAIFWRSFTNSLQVKPRHSGCSVTGQRGKERGGKKKKKKRGSAYLLFHFSIHR